MELVEQSLPRANLLTQCSKIVSLFGFAEAGAGQGVEAAPKPAQQMATNPGATFFPACLTDSCSHVDDLLDGGTMKVESYSGLCFLQRMKLIALSLTSRYM